MGFDPLSDYPLGSRRPDLVRTASGLRLDQLTLAAVLAGEVELEDLRATPETLLRQSAIARAAGRSQLADNLARAAELGERPERDDPRDLHRASPPSLDRGGARGLGGPAGGGVRGTSLGRVRAGGGRGVRGARPAGER